jgi:transcriptional regulator GlxA family with amidase domain
MKKVFGLSAYVLSFVLGIAVFGSIGFKRSMDLMVAQPDLQNLPAGTHPVPHHDYSKPTVAVLLGNTATESTDFLAPHAMFSESGAYNVYAIASSRALFTLAGCLEVVPHYSFAELGAKFPEGPDMVVVPAMSDAGAPVNASVREWIQNQAHRGTVFFSWCEGAEVLALSGVIEGKTVTTHWASIDRFERNYPAVHWKRGVRYIDSDRLITTAGLTSGIDATLHFLVRHNGRIVAQKVAAGLHIPESPFVANPQMEQYSFTSADSIAALNLAFGWPKRRTGLVLRDGVDEVALTAALDVYQATDRLYTAASGPSVISRHGLELAPRWDVRSLPALVRKREIRGAGQNPGFAIYAALQDLARQQDVPSAAFAAKRLEIRAPLSLSGSPWPMRNLLVCLLSGLVGVANLRWGRSIANGKASVRCRRGPLVVASVLS